MADKTQCSATVSDNWYRNPCRKKATSEVDGKYYCGTHNPINVKRRDEKASKKYDEEVNESLYKHYSNIYCKKRGLTLKGLEEDAKLAGEKDAK